VSKNIVHWDDVPARTRTVGDISGTWRALGRAAGMRNVGLNRIEVAPGCRSTAVHAHGAEEEIFFVLAGEGLLYQGGRTCEVGEGDCIVHVARSEPHVLLAGDEGLDVLVYGPDVPVEACYLPRAEFMFLGPAAVQALPDRDGWRRDVESGPFEAPAPGERFANVVNLADAEPEPFGRGDVAASTRFLGASAGSVATGLNHDTIEHGMLNAPPHCHSAEDEVFVVVRGSGTCLLGDEEHAVREGHVIGRPAGTGVAHTFRGGPDGMEVLVYGTRVSHDSCWYPRSNKVLIGGLGGVIFRVERAGYWDGEEDFEPVRRSR
jgi:uncharacterized cupin superfamily protein